jgi:multicomponent Na+:H+ antiporter subunit A
MLMCLTVATGVVPISLDHLVNAAAQSLIEVEEIHLALWHGFKPALWLSILTIALGVGMAWSAGAVEQLQERLGGWPGSQRAYDRSLEWLLVGADRLAGVVQNGSLPIYLSVILLTAVLLPGWWLVQVPTAPEPLVLAAGPVQAIVAAGVIVAAIGLATARRRFSAVLMLGAAGYGVALLFVVQGAPDLALTQFLIETLSVVIFVLVLRYLPPWFADRPWQLGRVLRLTTSVAVGLFAFFLALTSGNARLDSFTPVSQAFLERSIEEAGGHNVVNVILVDFRGLDTLGEITVLLIAALGVVALVLASRRDQGVGQHPRDLARSDEAEPRAVPSGDGARPDHEQPETATDHDRVEAER